MTDQAICAECKYERPKRDLPPFVQPIEVPGIVHHDWCPTLPRLDAETIEKLRKTFEDLDRARAEALRGANDYVIWR